MPDDDKNDEVAVTTSDCPHYSLLPIDVGFDLKCHDMKIDRNSLKPDENGKISISFMSLMEKETSIENINVNTAMTMLKTAGYFLL